MKPVKTSQSVTATLTSDLMSTSISSNSKKRPAARTDVDRQPKRADTCTSSSIRNEMIRDGHSNEENLLNNISTNSLQQQLLAIRAKKHADFVSQDETTNANATSNSNGGRSRGKIGGSLRLPLPSVVAGKYGQSIRHNEDDSHPQPIHQQGIEQQPKQQQIRKCQTAQHRRQDKLVQLRIQTCIGMQYCDDKSAIIEARLGDDILLELEPSNKYDENAIRVVHQDLGKKLGYIAGNENKELNQLLLKDNSHSNNNNATIEAIIAQKTDKYILLLVRVYDDQEASASTSTYLQPASTTATLYNHGTSISISHRIAHGWIRWIPHQESLEHYVLSVRPSQIDASICHWICIDNHDCHSLGHIAHQLKTETLRAAQDDDNDSNLTLVGKWLVFLGRKNHDLIDTTWMKIATATAQGKLGCSSKIAPSGGEANNAAYSSSTVCCVYVKDFTDKQEVKRVVVSLRDILGPKQRISGFKTDMTTMMGMYGAKTTFYSESEALQWRD